MNYKQTNILVLVSALALSASCTQLIALASCSNLVDVKAQTPQQIIPQKSASVLPPQPSANVLANPLTYKIESYVSKVMEGNRTYGVALPPGYEENPNQRYPVIFLLHGGHGDPHDWFKEKRGNALMTLQQLYATGKLPPSIIITPDGNDRRGSSPYWDPQYIDGLHGQVSTAVGDELVKVVKDRYRTLPTPNFWAIGGLSSGGWGAVNVGLHNLDNFSILFSHSGYFRDKSGPQNSPISYIKTISPQAQKRIRIYLDTGKSDEELDEAQKFSQVLSQEKIYNVFRQFPGSHTWSYWREHLADSLTFVGEQFKILEIQHAADNLGFKKP
ncbi:alpha/beta hydrolase [Scytonema sp. NUACC26]|uniref:alpha/beta hydrolase n=1 Tax=Scytonema sp. NUACC26 TaxID=3140176 RepID=UPI0034DCC270